MSWGDGNNRLKKLYLHVLYAPDLEKVFGGYWTNNTLGSEQKRCREVGDNDEVG